MLELFGHPKSPPCRAVQLLLEELQLEFKYNLLHFEKGDLLKPEYVALNPQHTMPMLRDGDFKMLESRAIMGYLVNKYGSKDVRKKLYPDEPAKLRAKIDQRLHFDMGVLYKAYENVVSTVDST